MFDLDELLDEYDRARAYTDTLWRDLSEDEVRWRPRPAFSPIGWHLGHQAAVAHFMVRNLTAAEPSPDADLEPIMDSANPEEDRGALPSSERIAGYRTAVAARVHARLRDIDRGAVHAPAQLRIVGRHLLVALINHEYQHDQWISEVRAGELGRALPSRPVSDRLSEIDGYTVVAI
ncbi:MAG TPA: DinB family protein [Propionibacteriaceae bacterium]|nr:DinB family protein [Propionibacteriaceae bacterium]